MYDKGIIRVFWMALGNSIPSGSDVVARLNPMASATVSVPFNTSGYVAGETLKIYAVIGPLPAGTEEMHEENDKAYAQLPIVAQVATGPGDPASLYLAEGDIVFDPPAPSAGQTLHISATVHARSQTFDWVEVVFWDGKPLAGGKEIDGQLIPVILAGESQAADIYWPTGASFGEHELWVTIVPHSQEWVITDNAAHVAVSLAPYPNKLHLPEIFKQQ
jgi:hypothetical protein